MSGARPARLPEAFDPHRGGQRWGGLLAARAASALHRAVAHPLAEEQREASRLTQAGSLLERQLSSPVGGETAPQDLLLRFADVGVSVSREARRAAASRGTSRTQPPGASHGETTTPIPDAFASADARRGASVLHQLPDLPSESRRELTRAAASDSDPAGASVSPAVAESVPPLLPPPSVGMPVLPMALATAREGARRESLETEEDLDALAAKIKLILDEQARRHGIDV